MSCDHKENLLLELALYRWSHCLLLAACRHDLPINGMLNVEGRAVGGDGGSWSVRKDDSSSVCPIKCCHLVWPKKITRSACSMRRLIFSPTSNELRLRKFSDLLSELQQWPLPPPFLPDVALSVPQLFMLHYAPTVQESISVMH